MFSHSNLWKRTFTVYLKRLKFLCLQGEFPLDVQLIISRLKHIPTPGMLFVDYYFFQLSVIIISINVAKGTGLG